MPISRFPLPLQIPQRLSASPPLGSTDLAWTRTSRLRLPPLKRPGVPQRLTQVSHPPYKIPVRNLSGPSTNYRGRRMKLIIRILKDDAGATAIEYGLMAALISVAAITAMGMLGNSLSNTFTYVSGQMTNAQSGKL
jgi:pilus assembly protein Flp/PilA